MRIWNIISKLSTVVTGNKQNSHKPEREADDEWGEIWDDIYEFQHTLSIDSLPSDEKKLKKAGLYIICGKNAEKLFINKELSTRPSRFRCSH